MATVRDEITDYHMLNALGSGSYSTVYRARHKRTRECVAVKTVAKARLSKSSTDNLVTEIGLLKNLKHRYIVEMLDFMWDDRNIYIVLELCAAGDLSAYVRRHRRLPETTCKFFLRQLALAIRYMRQHNVSHFDLKPHNLLLAYTPMLTLKVADFGFAQHLQDVDQQPLTQLKGSPLYMAPEILLARRYDPLADLWSIGCILYECLFGAAPYRSRDMAELVQKVRQRQPIVYPAEVPVSERCSDLMRRLLVHEPSERIRFGEFFAHAFLDIEHEPNDEHLGRAVGLITRAVALDKRGQYAQAYAAYCEGLQLFVPLIAAERHAHKRQQMRINADAYLRRAEEMRAVMRGGSDDAPATAGDAPRSADCAGAKIATANERRCFEALRKAAQSQPAIRDGMEFGQQAEMYTYEGNYDVAIELYRKALGMLVPALSAEPKGKRRELLHELVRDWMTAAEQVKTLLDTREMLAVDKANAEEGEECTEAAGRMCCMQ